MNKIERDLNSTTSFLDREITQIAFYRFGQDLIVPFVLNFKSYNRIYFSFIGFE